MILSNNSFIDLGLKFGSISKNLFKTMTSMTSFIIPTPKVGYSDKTSDVTKEELLTFD